MLLRRLLGFYRTQADLLWSWRPGRRALVRRAIVSFLVSLAAFVFTAAVLPGIRVRDLVSASIAVIVLAALNLLVRPVLLFLAASWSLILVGVLAIVFQVAVILVLVPLVPGLVVDGFWTAVAGSFVFAFANTALTSLLSLDDGESYYGALVRILATRERDVLHSDRPGLVIVQIDGLAHDVLTHAIRAGRAPVLSGLVRGGSHRLTRWEALLPSSTPASQAGILHGRNDGIPNFRWWEKDPGRLLVANRAADARTIAARISDGKGLLSNGGASVNSLLSGDAPRAFLTVSAFDEPGQGLGKSRAFYWFFVSPYNYMHIIFRSIAEVVRELYQARRERLAHLEPRLDRAFPYPLMRAATCVVLRALDTSLVLGEMYRGTPVIYVDYGDYDEVAHHSGPERSEALDALDGVDRVIGQLLKAGADAPRPYRFMVLSDHGQTLGATFSQRYGETLHEVVASLMGGEASVHAATAQVEDWGQLNSFLSELTRASGATGRLARAAFRKRTVEGVVELGPSAAAERRRHADSGTPGADLVVCAGGNLGLIYFNARAGRLSLEEIAELEPSLVEALANHPGIGLLLVHSDHLGPICVGKRGLRYLDSGKVEGEDPTAIFGEHAIAALTRLDGMAHVADLVAISTYDPETEEIASFEEQVGSHGGLGGAQTRPFLLYPSDWSLDDTPLVGAPMLHDQLARWVASELEPEPGDTGAREVATTG